MEKAWRAKLLGRLSSLLLFGSFGAALAQSGPGSIVFPSAGQHAFGPRPVVCESQVRIKAYDLAFREDVTSVTFDWSPDGTQWNLIGTDTDPSPEPPLPPEPVPQVVPGYSGWNVFWGTTGLAEGKAYMRAIVSYASGPPAETIQEVYFTSTPPEPHITSPTFLRVVTGKFPVSAICASLTIQCMQVDMLPVAATKDGKHEQDGFKPWGGAADLWRSGYCAPGALAQAIWRLAQKNPALLNVTDKIRDEVREGMKKYKLSPRFSEGDFIQDGKLTFRGLMLVLAVKMGTTGPPSGQMFGGGATNTDNIKPGVDQFLKEQGLNCTVPGGFEVKHTDKPTFKQYAEELNRGESVVINWEKYAGPGDDGKPGTEDDEYYGSHTMIGHNSVTDPEGKSNKASFLDSGNGAPQGEMTWKDNDPDAGGYSTVSFGTGEWYRITDMWSVSPKPKPKEKPKAPQDSPEDTGGWVPQGIDSDGADGWSVLCDASTVPDGLCVVRAIMTDAAGNSGQDFVLVWVRGKGPVGGVGELPAPAQTRARELALIGAIVAALTAALLAAGWYARKRRAG